MIWASFCRRKWGSLTVEFVTTYFLAWTLIFTHVVQARTVGKVSFGYGAFGQQNGTKAKLLRSIKQLPGAVQPQTFKADVSNSIFAEDYQVSFEVGRSVDLFNRFGFLQLSFKVLPGVYAGKPQYILIERSFPVFTPESKVIKLYKTPAARPAVGAASDNSTDAGEDGLSQLQYQVYACETVVDVLSAYFSNFFVEGLTDSFKAFVPDYKKAKLSRSFGIEEKLLKGDYRFLLIKVDLPRNTAVLDGDLVVTDVLKQKVEQWAPESRYDCLLGVGKVGSHVIKHLAVGDVVFQVH